MGFLAAAAPWLAAAGAGVQAISAISSANAQGEAAAYQAQVARNNAVIANQNAEYALQAGSEKATQTSQRGAALVGRVKSAIAANNIDVNTGSAADVEASTAEAGKLDTETVANNAALQAYGYRVAATGDTAQAQLYEAEAAQAPIEGVFGAAGSLLSNAGSIGLKWRGYQDASLNGGSAGLG